MAPMVIPSLSSSPIEDTLSQHTLEAALHTFFKMASEPSAYAVMLGGSLLSSELNQTVLIGLNPKQTIKVQNQTLTHTFFNPETPSITQKLNTSEPLFSYLRSQSWTKQAFLFSGYEFHQYCDPALYSQEANKPSTDDDLLLVDFEDIGQFDLKRLSWKWHSSSPERAQNYQAHWNKILLEQNPTIPAKAKSASLKDISQYSELFETSLSKPDFEKSVSTILGHIQSGDIYQANLSLSLKKEVSIHCPYLLYQALCQQNPSPFSAFLKTPKSYIISNSPERLLFAHLENNVCKLETRPIAGTRGRGKDEIEDTAIAAQLLESEKERAEHLMLVDLLRNDLGRVSKTGSVNVNELLTIERYSHVMHLVSNVTGELANGYDHWDALKSLFPGGTITGCPKIRCIQILNSLEPNSRGFYTGSLGYLNLSQEKPWGKRSLDWNILIRTLKLRKTDVTDSSLGKTPEPNLPYNAGSPEHPLGTRYDAHLQVGAGIVADSIASHEYRECYRKAQAILGALYVAEQLTNRPC